MKPWTSIEIHDAALRSEHIVDPVLVAGICAVESSGNPWSVRYEPAYRWLVPDATRPLTCTQDTELAMQRTSWGLCQIMGANARALGFTGWLTELLQPQVNLELCAQFLQWLFRRFGVQGDVISAYNAGSPRKSPDGTYRNQGYVDRVLAAMSEVQASVGGRQP